MYVEGHLGSNLSSSGGPFVGLKHKPCMDFCWSEHGWEETFAPLKEFDPSQWSRGGPQWHRLVGRWCLCGWHLGFIFEKCMKILEEWKEHIGCTESMCYTTQNRPLMRSFFFSTFFSSIVRGSLQRCFELRYFLDDRGLSTFRRLCGP